MESQAHGASQTQQTPIEPGNIVSITAMIITMASRIAKILAVAIHHGYEHLVLGAWGCGAFANDPRRTATDFRQALETDFAGAFSDVVFAITDWSEERRFLGPFRDVFASNDD